VADLARAWPHIEFEIVTIVTTGDLRRDVPLASVGTKGMFVKELEVALASGEIDLAVHSLKDMPAELPAGLTLVCTPPRADPHDALVSTQYPTVEALPQGARVGTSSVRRSALLRHYRPDLEILDIRGNVDTRLRRLDAGDFDAIVLAAAGLIRLGLAYRIAQLIPFEVSVPAPGQGALAIEARATDNRIAEIAAAINHVESADAIAAERGFQAELNAGCSVPAGVIAEIIDTDCRVTAVICAPDGSATVRETVTGPRDEARSLGSVTARRLLAAGGLALLP
jgi:hydroxymethylbilane synthase